MDSKNTAPIDCVRASGAARLIVLALLVATAVGASLCISLREPPAPPETSGERAASAPPLSYRPEAIGLEPVGYPIITHVAIGDLDQDGLLDVLVTDAAANRVGWIRQGDLGQGRERGVGLAFLALILGA